MAITQSRRLGCGSPKQPRACRGLAEGWRASRRGWAEAVWGRRGGGQVAGAWGPSQWPAGRGGHCGSSVPEPWCWQVSTLESQASEAGARRRRRAHTGLTGATCGLRTPARAPGPEGKQESGAGRRRTRGAGAGPGAGGSLAGGPGRRLPASRSPQSPDAAVQRAPQERPAGEARPGPWRRRGHVRGCARGSREVSPRGPGAAQPGRRRRGEGRRRRHGG